MYEAEEMTLNWKRIKVLALVALGFLVLEWIAIEIAKRGL
jgi:hypothetical protein